MTVSDVHAVQLQPTTIEIDPLGPTGGLLVTLRSGDERTGRQLVSILALTGHPQLEELPELLRVVGLALVFGDGEDAHRACGRLLMALCEA